MRFAAVTVYASGSWDEHGDCELRRVAGRWEPVCPEILRRLERVAARARGGTPMLIPRAELDRLPETPCQTEIP